MISWKSGERAIAKLLGCERIPVTGRVNKRGKPADLISNWLAVEVKCYKSPPKFLAKVMAQAQAGESFARIRDGRHRLPIGVIHADYTDYKDSFVVLSLGDFIEHFGGSK